MMYLIGIPYRSIHYSSFPSGIVLTDPSKLLDWKELDTTLSQTFVPLHGFEEVEYKGSIGRIAIEDIHSPMDLPGFNKSLMDGYAVGSNSGQWEIIGEIPIGIDPKDKSLSDHEAIRVATGSVVPEGTYAVVPVENVNIADKTLRSVEIDINKGVHIEPKGSDIQKNQVLIRKGEMIRVNHLTALAAVGLTQIKVLRKPKFSIVSTGDEVKEPGEILKTGEVYDATTAMIASLIKQLGGEITAIFGTGEKEGEISSILDSIAETTDVVLTIGGTSVGKHDNVSKSIEKHGEIIFHGINVRPGKPILLGRIRSTPVLGFPGFVTSSAVMASLFLPKIFNILTSSTIYQARVKDVFASDNVQGFDGWYRVVPGKIEGSLEDNFTPTFTRSSSVTPWLTSTGYIVIPPDKKGVAKGEKVQFYEYMTG